jgi:hypothetical protein
MLNFEPLSLTWVTLRTIFKSQHERLKISPTSSLKNVILKIISTNIIQRYML